MTTREALLAAILSDPQDDTPRLIYADWLDENDEPDRAEFVRVQVELARCGYNDKPDPFNNDHLVSLRRRERELIDTHAMYWKWHGGHEIPLGMAIAFDPRRKAMTFTRGFVSSLRVSWSDWLAHEAAIYWHPKQTVECPKCNGTGSTSLSKMYATELRCRECEGEDRMRGTIGTGRIPRPFVATAQPLEEVRLTMAAHRYDAEAGLFIGDWFVMPDLSKPGVGYRFDRVKCDGSGGLMRNPCKCQLPGAVPLNLWTCDKWPGVTFAMPEAMPQAMPQRTEFRRSYIFRTWTRADGIA